MADSSTKSGVADDEKKVVTQSGHRGIPAAEFMENVDDYLVKTGKKVEEVHREANELYGKYKFMENNLVQQRRALLRKMPDMKTALSTLEMLLKKRDAEENMDTTYMLADQIFAKADVAPENKVYLWLGANVMLEYTYDEAKELLERNYKNASIQLESLTTDLDFLKDQCAIEQVKISRCHNYMVKQRQLAKAAGKPA